MYATSGVMRRGGLARTTLRSGIPIFGMKLPLPAAQIIVSFAKIGRQHRQPEQHAVDDVDRESKGLFEVDEQDHTGLGGFVPGIVLVGIVKNQNLPFAPASPLGPDSNSQIVAVFGDQEAEMKPEHSVVRAAVWWQPLARLEHRKHR